MEYDKIKKLLELNNRISNCIVERGRVLNELNNYRLKNPDYTESEEYLSLIHHKKSLQEEFRLLQEEKNRENL